MNKSQYQNRLWNTNEWENEMLDVQRIVYTRVVQRFFPLAINSFPVVLRGQENTPGIIFEKLIADLCCL
jgi:hypothetical protein